MRAADLLTLETDFPIWERFFLVAPLLIVGSKERSGGFDLAAKHMATPIGWQNYYGFVCSPRHHTYDNIAEHGAFTVSFPRPDHLVETSLTATSRDESGAKPALEALETFPAAVVDGVLVADCDLYLECELERVVDGFGENSLIVGRVVHAAATPGAVRVHDRDDGELLFETPLTAYLQPGRIARISESYSFPYAVDFTL
jgi:flavin reductase (DIM6/NTAB) family NADH-FMN oxidoreductase RutF